MDKRCETCRYSSSVKKEILNVLICLNGEVYRTTMNVSARACEKYEETYNADDVCKFTLAYSPENTLKTQ